MEVGEPTLSQAEILEQGGSVQVALPQQEALSCLLPIRRIQSKASGDTKECIMDEEKERLSHGCLLRCSETNPGESMMTHRQLH